jgi:hypothetical protein
VLHEGGCSVDQGQTFIDDTRCLLYALKVLERVSPSLVRTKANPWLTIGALSGAILLRAKQIPIVFDRPAILDRFRRKFSDPNTSWVVRAPIINGFKQVAARLEERDDAFWEIPAVFLQTCVSALSDAGGKPEGVDQAKDSLVDFWWGLARKFGKEHLDVKRQVAKNSLFLLQLIEIQDAPKVRTQANRWYESLRELDLPYTEDRDPDVRSSLEQLADEIRTRMKDQNWCLREWFEEVKEEFLPYLDGRERRQRRPRRLA